MRIGEGFFILLVSHTAIGLILLTLKTKALGQSSLDEAAY